MALFYHKKGRVRPLLRLSAAGISLWSVHGHGSPEFRRNEDGLAEDAARQLNFLFRLVLVVDVRNLRQIQGEILTGCLVSDLHSVPAEVSDVPCRHLGLQEGCAGQSDRQQDRQYEERDAGAGAVLREGDDESDDQGNYHQDDHD